MTGPAEHSAYLGLGPPRPRPAACVDGTCMCCTRMTMPDARHVLTTVHIGNPSAAEVRHWVSKAMARRNER